MQAQSKFVQRNNYNLAGKHLQMELGIWSVISGPATLTTPSSPTSGVTGYGFLGQTATLRWTISNGSCATSPVM
jgi:hypothetical protein